MMYETIVENNLPRDRVSRSSLPMYEGVEESKQQHDDESFTGEHGSLYREYYQTHFQQQQPNPQHNRGMPQHGEDDQEPPSLSRSPVTAKATSSRGPPPVVSLRGGVRGGHSVLSSKIHPSPLGLSTDYYGAGAGGATNEHGSNHNGTNQHNTAFSGSVEWWPKGLSNVGNTCYANATLQCLLSTALTSALLDPRTVPILRRYSSNPNLLAMGSGSVDSDDDEADDDEDEEDGILRVVDSHGVASVAAAVVAIASSQKKKNKKAKKNKKGIHHSNSNGYSFGEDEAKRKEREKCKMEENCKWLTSELTSITQDYMDESRSAPNSGASRSSMIGAWLSSTTGTDHQARDHCVVINPGSITRHPDRLSKCLRPYQQEDAHEFLRALLSTLVMNGHNKQLSSLFDGLLESSVTCQTCGRASLTRDRYMDLSLDIHNVDIATLDDALYEFTKTEQLTEDNAVFCQKCHKKRSVTKGLRLATAPSILVCHLKRFAYDSYGRLVRLHKRIEFPQLLEIGDYMSNLNKARPPPYDLVGVLVHQGQTCASGHYLAFVKKNGQWFKCNDSEVTKVDEETVKMQQAYILMYEVAEMRENACFKPNALKKEPSIMTTIESDEAEMSKEDVSAHASHWSSEHSTSKRTYSRSSSYTPGYGHNETTAESLMRLLRDAGVTQFISDLCCDSSNDGTNEPETHTLRKRNHVSNNANSNHSRSGLRNRKDNHAHECESVDTQDSLIRRHALMNNSAVNVLEVERKSTGRSHRAQTAPRQRLNSYDNIEPGFDMVSPYATFTPRAGGGVGGGHRKYPSLGGVTGNKTNTHDGSTSSSSTKSKRREREQRDRDRTSATGARYTMPERAREDLPPLIPNPGQLRRRKSGNTNTPKKSSSANVD